jgi:hypothetical protein
LKSQYTYKRGCNQTYRRVWNDFHANFANDHRRLSRVHEWSLKVFIHPTFAATVFSMGKEDIIKTLTPRQQRRSLQAPDDPASRSIAESTSANREFI